MHRLNFYELVFWQLGRNTTKRHSRIVKYFIRILFSSMDFPSKKSTTRWDHRSKYRITDSRENTGTQCAYYEHGAIRIFSVWVWWVLRERSRHRRQYHWQRDLTWLCRSRPVYSHASQTVRLKHTVREVWDYTHIFQHRKTIIVHSSFNSQGKRTHKINPLTPTVAIWVHL